MDIKSDKWLLEMMFTGADWAAEVSQLALSSYESSSQS